MTPAPPTTLKILFVCMGNICRSPAAEAVFRHLVEESQLTSLFHIDSAGTLDYHTGEPADARMRKAAQARGYDLTSRARQIHPQDLDTFDLILTMDEDNRRNVLALTARPTQREKIHSFCDYCTEHSDTTVPDPYYGGPRGFEHVLDLLEDGCQNLLAHLEKRLSP